MAKIEPMLSIHLTDKCNNRCLFCIVDSPSYKEEQVSDTAVDTFLRTHKGQGYTAVNLHGGEPTIRKNFFEILQKINDYGYSRIILQTNGRRLANEEFARKVYNSKVDYFVISVHAKDKATAALITQVHSSFDQTIQGIKNVKQLGAKVRTNTVVSRLNYCQLLEIIDLLFLLNVDHINISALHTGGTAYRNFEKVTPTYTEIRSIVREAAEKVIVHGTHLTLEGFPYCTIPHLEQYIVEEKFKMLYHSYIFNDYEEFMNNEMRVTDGPCLTCPEKKKCGGVYKEYIEKWGWDEFGYC